MPTEPIAHEYIADLMEHCGRVVAETRDTVSKTRRILRECKQHRERYLATHPEESAASHVRRNRT